MPLRAGTALTTRLESFLGTRSSDATSGRTVLNTSYRQSFSFFVTNIKSYIKFY